MEQSVQVEQLKPIIPKFLLKSSNKHPSDIEVIAKTAAFVEKNPVWEKIYIEVLEQGIDIQGLKYLTDMDDTRKRIANNFSFTLGNAYNGWDDDFFPGMTQLLSQVTPLLQQNKKINIDLSIVKPSSAAVKDRQAAQSPMHALQTIKEQLSVYMEHLISFSIRSDHPDIELFINSLHQIHVKNTIFIIITDEFMDSVFSHSPFTLKHKIKPEEKMMNNHLENKDYFLCNANKVWKQMNAICQNKVVIIFENRQLSNDVMGINPSTHQLIKENSTLISAGIDLRYFLEQDTTTRQYQFNKDSLSNCIKIIHRMLDNLGLMSKWPSAESQLNYNTHRRINIEIKHLGEALKKMANRTREQMIDMGDDIVQFIHEQSFQASTELAKERGTERHFKGMDIINRIARKNLSKSLLADIERDGLRNYCTVSLSPYSLFPINHNKVDMKFLPILKIVDRIDQLSFKKPRKSTKLSQESEHKMILEQCWNQLHANRYINTISC